MNAASSATLTAYVDTTVEQPLIASAPRPGTVTAERALPQGITEWKLSNGATVLIKPTTFKQDEILMRAFSPGGTSLASDADYVPAFTAAQVAALGGLGTFSQVDLSKKLAGTLARVDASIGNYYEELSGQASPKDVETMFQELYLRFTAPRADPAVFKIATDQLRTQLQNTEQLPEVVYNRTLSATIWQNHPRAMPMTSADIDRMSLEKSIAFYKDRFADASDFTFVFVGNIDPVTFKPLVERYVASLPAPRRGETWKDVGLRRAAGVIEKTVEKGLEAKAQTTIVFNGPFVYDEPHRVTMRAMAMVLDGLLRESLREDLGGTYGVSVQAVPQRVPIPAYAIQIGFGSSPDRVDELTKTVFEKIDQLKQNGPNERDVTSIREIFLRELEASTRQNGFYLSQIASRVQNGEELAGMDTLADTYRTNINGPAIQQAARDYFNVNNYVKVTLVPEKK
jgi:zinc protease